MADRRNGHLSKALGMPILAGETQDEIARLGKEDRAPAERGSWSSGTRPGISHRHVDDLVPEDGADRARAEGAWFSWLTERSRELRAGLERRLTAPKTAAKEW